MGLDGPRFGIILPIHRQPLLADEALASIMDQPEAQTCAIAAIDDGCPLAETEATLRAWAAIGGPARLHVIRRPNGGLSAARNTGVQVLLGRYPQIRAIFALDADNRLAAGAVALWARLLDDHPDAQWFYPQFDLFGLADSTSNGNRYSLLWHAQHNFSDAGSLMRRSLFDAGLRYDETLRHGYEDWDLWLRAAQMGLRGHPVAAPMLHYRKRPESMLSGAQDRDGHLRAQLHERHAWLFHPKTALALEQAETPRFRILHSPDQVRACTDPLSNADPVMDADAFAAEVWGWCASGGERPAGALWIAARPTAWAALRDAGALRFALWDLERRSGQTRLATLTLTDAPDGPHPHALAHDAAGLCPEGADLIALPAPMARSALEGAARPWLCDLDTLWAHAPTAPHRMFGLPNWTKPTGPGAAQILAECVNALWMHRMRPAAQRTRPWRLNWLPPTEASAAMARATAGSGVLYPGPSAPHALPRTANPAPTPRTTNPAPTPRPQPTPYSQSTPGSLWAPRQRRVCFVVPIAEFGGAETVARNVAQALRKVGFETALCILGPHRLRRTDGLACAFDEVLWFPEPSLQRWEGPPYAGTALPRLPEGADAADLFGLLAGFDAVIGCHAAGALGVFGALQRAGVRTALYEHVHERSAYGRPQGTPMLALAWEAAVDKILTCSAGLATWMQAQGVPGEKLIALPNAAGYPMTSGQITAALTRRSTHTPDGPLHALFMGRFDRQKGLERLVDLVQRTQDAPVSWRIVGKAVVEDATADLAPLAGKVTIEAPVFTDAARTDLYTWADVLVMPSRFEGLPLGVLEAQRCGAVPIATRTGQIEEAISDGIDGVLVDQTGCVPAMEAILRSLAADRAQLGRLSTAAARPRPDWDQIVCPLVDWLAAD